MTETQVLSQARLAVFLTCPRQYQLRYRRRLAWPNVPEDDRSETALTRGQQFHLLLERHFLGLAVPLTSIGDATVAGWYQTFTQHNPVVENGRFLPEHRLTVPIGDHLLLGRFDLLVVGEANGVSFAHVYDWKTGRAKRDGQLRQEWQTRLYLALLAESGGALAGNGRSLPPENINLTYWYVSEPEAPRTISYSAQDHQQNWADIQAIITDLDAHLAADKWPLTDDWDPCRRCAYQVYCGRQEAGLMAAESNEEPEVGDADFLLEPDLP